MQTRAVRYFEIGLFILPMVVAWLLVPQLANAFQIKSYVATLAILVLAFVYLSERMQSAILLPTGVVGIALSLVIFAALVSTSLNGNTYQSWVTLIELMPYLILVFCIVNLPTAEPALTHIESGILCAAGGVALFGLKQFFLPHFLDPGFHALGKMRVYSTLGNPNLAAICVLAALPLSVQRYRYGRTLQRVLYATVFLILLGYLVVSQSRQALLAVGIMGVAAAIWLGSRRLRRALLIGLGLVLGTVAMFLLYADIPGALTHAAKGRWFIWRSAWEMLWDHPVTGVGLGQFSLWHMAYQARLFATGGFGAFQDNAAVIQDAHNEFLNWGATTGVVGLLGFGLLCLAVLRQGWRSENLKKNAPQLYIALVGYVFVMLFTAVLPTPGTALIFWLLLGSVLRLSDSPSMQWRPPSPWRYTVLSLLAGLLVAGAGWTLREIPASYYQAQANQLMQERDLWLASRKYRAALAWHPENGVLLKEHATTLFLAGHLPEALDELGQARRYSGDVGIPILQGEIQTRLGNYAAAVSIYQGISAAFPNMVSPHFVLGQIYALQGKEQLAEGEFRKVLAIEPSPYNLNMTTDKIDLQKQIVRQYLQGDEATAAPNP